MAEDENKGLFSSLEISAIGEMMNISLGSAATAVSTVLDRRVNITTPRVSVETRHEFEFSDMEPALAVEITYIEGLEGNNLMLLRKSDVRKILEIMMMTEIPEDNFELDELSMSAVCELMNQMMGSAATAMSELLGEAVNISTPIAFEVEDPKAFNEKYFEDDHPMVIVSFDLEIEDCLDSEFMSLMGVGLVKKMISEFGITADVSDSGSSQPAPAAEPQSDASSQPNAAPQQAPPAQDQQQYADPYQQQVPPMQGQPYADPYQQPYPGGMYPPYPYPPQYYAPPNQPRMINVQNMTGQFDNITQLTKAEEGNLDLIMSVPLQVSVEIGRTKKQVRDILSLSQGSLVVLDKLAGEQVDVFVNGQHVAKGDVVVVDDNFGVRITEIVKDPEQLIKGNQNG